MLRLVRGSLRKAQTLFPHDHGVMANVALFAVNELRLTLLGGNSTKAVRANRICGAIFVESAVESGRDLRALVGQRSGLLNSARTA
jgi:hypothetical protein